MKSVLGIGFWSIVAAGGAVVALSACGGGGESDGSGGTSSSSTPSSSSTDTASSTGGGNGDGGAGSTTSDSSSTSSDTSSSSSSGGGSGISQCSTAVLFAGDPYYDGELVGADPAGQDLLADPPLRVQRLAAFGSSLLIDTGYEFWLADVDAATPTAVRIAGDELAEVSEYVPSGDCADVRLISDQGGTILPNGNVVVVDQVGNGLIELSGVGTAGCTASPLAGNATAIAESDIDEDVADPGDVDGPGAGAKLHAPRSVTSDADGNVYFVDEGNWKVKKIAADGPRTVSTLGSLQELFDAADGNVLALTAFGGKVYAAGVSHGDDVLAAFDGSGGTVVYAERPHFPEQDSSQTVLIAGAANDGTALILYGTTIGYVWKVALDGTVTATLAGSGLVVDFPDLDTSGPIPTDQLPLKTPSTQLAPVAVVGSSVFVAAVNDGTGQHIWRLDCE